MLRLASGATARGYRAEDLKSLFQHFLTERRPRGKRATSKEFHPQSLKDDTSSAKA